MSKETITNQDIWQFVQHHKKDSPESFLSWLLGQHYRPTNKIIKAICAWNERHKK